MWCVLKCRTGKEEEIMRHAAGIFRERYCGIFLCSHMSGCGAMRAAGIWRRGRCFRDTSFWKRTIRRRWRMRSGRTGGWHRRIRTGIRSVSYSLRKKDSSKISAGGRIIWRCHRDISATGSPISSTDRWSGWSEGSGGSTVISGQPVSVWLTEERRGS